MTCICTRWIVVLIAVLGLAQTEVQAAVIADFTPVDQTTLTAGDAVPLPFLTNASPSWVVNFDGTASSDGTNGITSYAWDFNYNNITPNFTSSAAKPTYTYTTPGSYQVALQVTGVDGTSLLTVHTIHISPTTPIANAGSYPTPFDAATYAAAGVWTVPFNASGTTDASQNVQVANLFYLWDLGTDTFSGTSLDSRKWAAADVTVNNGATVTGAYSWNNSYLFTTQSVTRAPGTAVEMTVSQGDGNAMCGFINPSGGYSYGNMPYAMYLTGNYLDIYENQSYVFSYGAISGSSFDLRIELSPTAGAIYAYRETGTIPWTIVYTSTNGNAATLNAGATIYSGTYTFSSIDLQQGGIQPNLPVFPIISNGFPQSATESLTVIDNALDSATASAVVTLSATAPVADAGSTQSINEASGKVLHGGWTATLDGSGSTPQGNLQYSWNLGTDTFPGTTIEPNWTVGSTVTENNALIITNNSYQWGVQTAWSNSAVARPCASAFVATLSYTDSYAAVVGLSSTGNGKSYSGITYGLWFEYGSLYVYEDGNYRASVGSYTSGVAYDIRIDLNSGSGATYYIRQHGATAWNLLYVSTYSSNGTFNQAFDVYNGTLTVTSVGYYAGGVQPTCVLLPPAANTAMPVVLTITTPAELTSSATVTINCNGNQPPVAQLAAVTPLSNANANHETWTATLDASGSSDDFEIYQIAWDFDYDGTHFIPTVTTLVDGNGGSIQPQSHVYSTSGTHSVAVQVTDEALQSSIATSPVVINLATPPVAVLAPVAAQGAANANQGMWTFNLDASGSTDSNNIYQVAWDFNYDGSNFVPTVTTTVDGLPSTIALQSTTYTTPGTYIVAMQLTDEAGQVSNTATTAAVINTSAPPVPTITVTNATSITDATDCVIDKVDGAVLNGGWNVSVSASAVAATPIFYYTWDFGTDTFPGTSFPDGKWTTSGSVVRDNGVTLTTPNGIATLNATDAHARGAATANGTAGNTVTGMAMETTVVLPGSGYGYIGFKNAATTTTGYSSFANMFYYYYGTLYCYENGNELFQGNYTGDTTYDLRIELKNTGARYLYRVDGTQTWNLFYEGGNDASASVREAYEDEGGTLVVQSERDLATGQALTYRVYDPGIHSVVLTAFDQQNLSGAASENVDLDPGQNPVAEISPAVTNANEGEAVNGTWPLSFDASGSYDPDDNDPTTHGIYLVEWDFNYDGVNFIPTATGLTVTNIFTPSSFPASYTVAAQVTDMALNQTIQTVPVTITTSAPPVAVIVVNPATEGLLPLQFDGTHSSGAFGIANYHWDFGDGSTGTGATPRHSYRTPGTYTVTLTVYDPANQSASTTASVTSLTGNPPVANAGGPYVTAPGGPPVHFSGGASTDDYGIVSYEWIVNTASGAITAGYPDLVGVAPMWTYPASLFGSNPVYPQFLTAQLTVVDGAGQTSSATCSVEVDAFLPPEVLTVPWRGNSNLPHPIVSGVPTRLKGTVRDGVPIADLQYQWNFGQATPATGTITINSLPADGDSVTLSSAVTVVNLTDSQTGTQGNVTLLASGSGVYALSGMGGGSATAVATGSVGFTNGSQPAVGDLLTISDGTVTDTFEIVNNNQPQAGNVAVDLGPTLASTVSALVAAINSSGLALVASTPGVTHTFEFDNNNSVSGSDIAVPIGADVPTTVANLASAINQDSSLGFTAAVSGSVITVANTQAGSAGNAPIALNSTVLTVSGMSGGADSPVSAWMAVSDPRNLELLHTYAGAPGRPFTATLTVQDTLNNVQASQTYLLQVVADTVPNRGDLAVDEGLWYLHKIQNADGSWNSSTTGQPIAASSGALQAMQINGHLRIGNQRVDPFATDVDLGLNALFTQMRANSITQSGINEASNGVITFNNGGNASLSYNVDSNSNGISIDANIGSPTSNYPPYLTGMMMDALAATTEPLGLANNSGSSAMVNGTDYVRGRFITDLEQDMIDQYAAGQQNNGGWRYSWTYGSSDNSISQWAAIGMGAAQDTLGIPIPPQIKTEDLYWLSQSQNTTTNTGTNYGCFGYGSSSPLYSQGSGDWSHAETPSGLVQLDFDDIPTTDNRWQIGEHWIADNWPPTNENSFYALYAMVKAMRLAKPSQVTQLQRTNGTTFDWYNDETHLSASGWNAPTGVRPYLVGLQAANGSWDGTQGLGSDIGTEIATAWGVIMLTPSLFVQPPVAVVSGPSVWAFDRQVRFNAAQSYDSDPTHKIISYSWWFDYNASANAPPDLVTTDPRDPAAVFTYVDPDQTNHATPPTTHLVHLLVTDNNSPAQQDAVTFAIIIAEPPHAPYSVPGGPYTAFAGIPFTLNGGGSYCIDPGDYITEYAWDMTNSGTPNLIVGSQHTTGFNGAGTPAASPFATYTYATPGVYNIALTVWDDGTLTQDGNSISSQPAYTTVSVFPRQPPVVDVNGPYTVSEGQALTLNSSGSHTPNTGEQMTFLWTVENPTGVFTTSTNPSPTFTWSHSGTYSVSLALYDATLGPTDPLKVTASTTVTVTHVPPTAAFSYAPQVVKAGISEQFTDLSIGEFSPIVSWAWTLGSAGTSTLQNPTATFANPGSQTVTLTVTDAQNATATYTQTFTVIKTGIVITQAPDITVIKGGATASYTAALSSAPQATVTVIVHPPTGLTVTPGILTFSSGNWNTPQTVVISAPDNHIAQGPQNVTITHTSSSSDPDYNGIAVDAVPVTIGDVDAADLTIRDSYEATPAAGAANVFQSSPTGPQVRTQYVSASASATYVITLINDNGISTSLAAKATGDAGNGWTVTATGPGGDITSALGGAGYTTAVLAPGASETLYLTLSPDGTVPSGTIATVTVTAGLSLSDSVVRDVVRARTIASLVSDGSFEIPGLLGSTVTHGAGDSIGPWVVAALLDHETGLAADGVQGISLEHGAIYQDLPTVPGTSYELRFAVYGSGAQGLTASWGAVGGSVTDVFAVPGSGTWTTPTGWTYYQFTTSTGAASGPSARLTFTDASVGVAGPVIDDVSMVSTTSGIQPDLLVKLASDPVGNYAGDSIYQTTPSGVQILSQNISSGTAAANVELVNNSPYARSFVVSATAALGAAWNLTTTLDSDQSDLSTAFANGGWTTPVLAPGAAVVIDVGLAPTGATLGSTASVDFTVQADNTDTTIRDAVRVTATLQAAPPNAIPDTASVAAGSTVDIPVLANDTDPNNLPLTVTAVGAAGHGTVVIVDAGTQVAYTAAGGYTGTDTFTYTVSNGAATATGTVTVAISALPPPVAVADTATVASGQVVTIPVLANDSDPSNLTLSVVAVTQPAHGAVTIVDAGGNAANPGTQVVYAATLGYSGTDTFTYTVSDGQATNTAQVTITVSALQPPVAVADSASVGAGGTVTIPVLANDSDPAGLTLSLVSVSSAQHGSAVVVGNSVSYTATVGYTGSDTFTYVVSDGFNTATGTVTIAVASPLAVNDSANAVSGQPVIIHVLANDQPLPNRPLSVISVTAPHHGTAAILNANGTPATPGVEVSYVSVGGYVGTDAFSYTASDGLASVSAQVAVTVTASTRVANPIAVADSVTLPMGTSTPINVLANDSDPQHLPLTITAVSHPAHGTVINTGTQVIYAGNAGYAGIDTFTYTISNGTSTATATVTVTLVPGMSWAQSSGTTVRGINPPGYVQSELTVTIPAPVTFTVTANIVLGTGNTAVLGTSTVSPLSTLLSPPAANDDLILNPTVSIPAGATSAAVPIKIWPGDIGAPAGVLANLVLTGPAAGAQPDFALTILDQRPLLVTVNGATEAGTVDLGSVAVGTSFFIRIADGTPPYTITASGGNTFFTYVTGGLFGEFATGDPDGDGLTDAYQQVLLSVISTGPGSLSIHDGGLNTTSVVLDYTATAPPQITLIPGQQALSVGNNTVYTPICPGTPQGLLRLRQALNGLDNTQIRMFAWDATTQQSVEWPQEPLGGLQPSSGLFLATRSNLNLDFSGDASPIFFSLTLLPGWNLVGVPPLSDGTNQYLVHPLTSFYLFDANGVNITDPNRSALIGSGVYLWDGSQYQLTESMNSGVGYWIKNNSTTHQTLTLVRFLDTPPAGFTFPTTGLTRAATTTPAETLVMGRNPDAAASAVASAQANGYAAKDIGTPPAPGGGAVTPTAAPANHASGGCGAGSAGVLLGLFATFLLIRRRRLVVK